MPLASSAAAVLLTRASSATVPNRRPIDRSRLGWTSLTMGTSFGPIRWYIASASTWRHVVILHLQILHSLVAHASPFGIGRRRPRRPARGGAAARPARPGCLDRTAAGPRHAGAPARDGSRKGERSIAG